MRVQCRLCEHEKGGFCAKKRNHGAVVKIKLTKRRNCDLYSEDPIRTLALYRKKEHHLTKTKAFLKQAQLVKAAAQINEDNKSV